MGKLFKQYLEEEEEEGGNKFVCVSCSTDLALEKSLIWEGFMGSELPAFLFRTTVNIYRFSEPRKQNLSTGLYTLCDVCCRDCGVQLGWEYITASSKDQKYKEGTVLLQKSLLQKMPCNNI